MAKPDRIIPAIMKIRNQTVELFRILAFVGVVMIHAWPGMGWAGRWAVPYFAFLACYFGHTADVEKLAKRLLPPFLAWSIIFAAVRFGVYGEYRGTAGHLWFLPFAFLAATATRARSWRWVLILYSVLPLGLSGGFAHAQAAAPWAVIGAICGHYRMAGLPPMKFQVDWVAKHTMTAYLIHPLFCESLDSILAPPAVVAATVCLSFAVPIGLCALQRIIACLAGWKRRGEWLQAIQSGGVPERGFESRQA